MIATDAAARSTANAAPVATRRRSERLDYIDTLRGIAALLVIWLHASEAFVQSTSMGAWVYDSAWAINSGRVGVVLFFAISGFVIPSSLGLEGGSRGRALRAFAIHRFFRLFPAYWLSVLLACLLGWLAVTAPISVGTGLANLTMVQTTFGYGDAIGLYWTLRIELVFYALCGLMFAAGVLHRPQWLAAGVVLGVAGYVGGRVLRMTLIPPDAWSDRFFQFPLYSLFLSFMFWGALVRCWHDGRLAVTRTPSAAVLVLYPIGLCTVPLLLAMINVVQPFPMFGTVAHAIGIGLFLLGITACRLGGRVGPWLGEISYSLYLFHPLVMATVLVLTYHGAPQKLGPHLATYVLVVMGLTIALSALTFYTVERPAIRLGRRLAPGRLGVQAAP